MNASEKRLQQLNRLLEISRELTSTVALEPLLHQIVEVAAELTDCGGSSLLLHDVRSGQLRFRAAKDEKLIELRDILVPVEGSIAGAVFTSGEPLIVSDAAQDPRHFAGVDRQIDHLTQSLLAVPLQYKDRRIGVLEALNKHDGSEFGAEDIEILTTLAAQATVAIETARLVSALQAAYEQLAELDKRKSDFIAIASHELRTPLGLILGYAAVLRESVDDAAVEHLDVVLRSASHLQQIIESMLNLSYLDTGEMVIVPTRFDLCQEVLDSCEGYKAMKDAKHLILEPILPREGVIIKADQEKIRVVLDNLISNAIKFSPADNRVRIAVRQQADRVEFEIADSGSGIPAQDLERIFDRFYQVEDHMTRRHGGMGLGLSIVKGLVELHGGTVRVESELGEGSCFTVSLPQRQQGN